MPTSRSDSLADRRGSAEQDRADRLSLAAHGGKTPYWAGLTPASTLSWRCWVAPIRRGNVDYRLLLEYLRVGLSAPPIMGVVVLVFFRMFKAQIANLIDRIKQLNWPGGGAVFGSQKRKEQEGIVANPQALTPGVAGQQVTLPQNVSLNSQEMQQVVQLIQAERANAALWEYRYLNFYLARSTQAVLDWLVASPQALSENLVDSYLQPFITDANERRAILDALQKHHLITISAGLIGVTPKGREYRQWRGPLPPIGTA